MLEQTKFAPLLLDKDGYTDCTGNKRMPAASCSMCICAPDKKLYSRIRAPLPSPHLVVHGCQSSQSSQALWKTARPASHPCESLRTANSLTLKVSVLACGAGLLHAEAIRLECHVWPPLPSHAAGPSSGSPPGKAVPCNLGSPPRSLKKIISWRPHGMM